VVAIGRGDDLQCSDDVRRLHFTGRRFLFRLFLLASRSASATSDPAKAFAAAGRRSRPELRFCRKRAAARRTTRAALAECPAGDGGRTTRRRCAAALRQSGGATPPSSASSATMRRISPGRNGFSITRRPLSATNSRSVEASVSPVMNTTREASAGQRCSISR